MEFTVASNFQKLVIRDLPRSYLIDAICAQLSVIRSVVIAGVL